MTVRVTQKSNSLTHIALVATFVAICFQTSSDHTTLADEKQTADQVDAVRDCWEYRVQAFANRFGLAR